MKLNKWLSIISFTTTLSISAQTVELPKTLFEYPMAPDSLPTLTDKTSYIVLRFWDKCDFKKALEDENEFGKAFNDYVSFMPYANIDSVKLSVTKLMNRLSKEPKHTLAIARAAENALYGPEAEFTGDEIYLMFARSVLSNKKIKEVDKVRYLEQTRILNGSILGAGAPALTYTTRYGATHQLHDQAGEFIVLFFNDPDCDECSMIKLRLSADVAVNNMLKSGRLKIVTIYSGEPDDNWKQKMSDVPYEWEVGANPEADTVYDLRKMPNIYLLDSERKIIGKDMSTDQILNLAAYLNQQVSPQ